MEFYIDHQLHPITFALKEKEKYGVTNFAVATLLAKSWGITLYNL
jgi:hypothetical protein